LIAQSTLLKASQTVTITNCYTKEFKITYNKALNYLIVFFNVFNRNGTKYKVAFHQKLFTAVLILQLYEEGKIDLNRL